MKKAKLFLLVFLLPVLFQVSCKKDDDTPKTPVYKQPTAAGRTEVVTIPTGLQARAETGTDLGATIAVTYMGLANAISSFGSSFVVPEGAEVQGKKSGGTVYYWSYGGYTYWMTYEELADKYVWTYDWEIPGTARFTYISAEESKDAKSGSWTIYDPEAPSQFVWTYDWSINSSNTFLASLVWNEGESESSFNVESNPDHSGSFKYYVVSDLKSDINWNADGSGTYWIDGDGGDDLVGNWTAK